MPRKDSTLPPPLNPIRQVKVEALERLLREFPQGKHPVEALETLIGLYYRGENVGQVEDAARRLLKLDPMRRKHDLSHPTLLPLKKSYTFATLPGPTVGALSRASRLFAV